MTKRFHFDLLVNTLLFFYIASINLIAHTGSILSILFAAAGIVFYIRSHSMFDMTTIEKWVVWMFVFYSAVFVVSFILNNVLLHPPNFKLKYIGDEMKMLLIFPLYIFFRAIRISKSAIWAGIVAGALLSGVYALFLFFAKEGTRASGSYDAIAFGDLSLVLAFMGVASYDHLSKVHRMFRYVIPTAFIFGMIACTLSGSRGAWASIPMLFVILFFFMSKYISRSRRLMLVVLACLTPIVAYQIPATNVAQRVDSAVSEISDYWKGEIQYGGATVRILGWQATMTIFSAHPLIGVGPGRYKSVVDQMIAQGELHEMTALHSQPLSTLLSTMASCGILGLVALMGIFIASLLLSFTLLKSHSVYRNIGYALMMLTVAFFHFGLFEIIFRRSVFTGFYIILVAAFMALAATLRDSLNKPAYSPGE